MCKVSLPHHRTTGFTYIKHPKCYSFRLGRSTKVVIADIPGERSLLGYSHRVGHYVTENDEQQPNT